VFTDADRTATEWVLENTWGDQMILPFKPCKKLRVVLLGTRSRQDFPQKTIAMAALLKSLGVPLYVLDTRRHGCGGQGSWAPLELATLIPNLMKMEHAYCFVHLPEVAPTVDLLEWWRNDKTDWRKFRERYDNELPPSAVRVAAAFVESAASRGGVAVLLCSEAYVEDFALTDESVQSDAYCHRYTLLRRIREYFAELDIEVVSDERVLVKPPWSGQRRPRGS
jgi:uncharacterized protein YeaO (DUF488 family)